MYLYMIRSKITGEVYVSDGKYACGPLNQYNDLDAPLSDYNLDNDAPYWVASEDGAIIRAEITH